MAAGSYQIGQVLALLPSHLFLFCLLNSESKRNTALEAIMLFGSGSANEIPTT
jgi:hypothetical protein